MKSTQSKHICYRYPTSVDI